MPELNEVLVLMQRLGAAVACGGLLGMEREWRRKPAGLRTHMMVALGAAAFTAVAVEMRDTMAAEGIEVVVDPTRLLQGIVTGIGFLGGGAIIQGRGNVEGLTTAATIWLVGALGVACGSGFYATAGVAVGFGLAVLLIIRGVESLITSRRQ